MKKTLTLAVAALMTAAFMTSCKKDYTCTCTILGIKQSTTIKDAKKKDAKAACEKTAEQAKAIGITDASCSI